MFITTELASFLAVTHMGCFNSRPVPTYAELTASLTPLYCARVCKEKDSANKVVGLYYHNQCYCGTEAMDAESNFYGCSADCQGDGTQVCGNNLRQNVYNIESDTSTLENVNWFQWLYTTVLLLL